MDIEGIRRRSTYRAPRLIVTERTRVLRLPAARPLHVQNGFIRDVYAVQKHNGVAAASPIEQKPSPVKPVAPNMPEPKSAQAEKKGKRRTSEKMIYALAAIVLIVGGLLAYQAFKANAAVETQAKKLQTTANSQSSSTLPTDEKPQDPNYLQNYKVAPQLPQLLTIQKIGVKARVLQVGVDKDNKMETPKTAYDVAWYTGSSRPGENGAMIIDGHVQGVGGLAVFSRLKELAGGDTLQITRGDGATLTYVVQKVERVPVNEVNMGKLLVSVDTAKPGLNLITCDGNYDSAADEFDSRAIVYAVQQ